MLASSAKQIILRLVRSGKATKEVAKYHARARQTAVHRLAANAWSLGVPGEEALKAAEAAFKASDSAKGRGKGRGKGPKRG